MSSAAALKRVIVASPLIATVAYAAVVSLLLVTVIVSIAGVFGQWADVTSLATLWEQLEGRKVTAAGRSTDASMPSGSAFLDGTTVTIAGAALIHRVEGAVLKYGGNVLSSQVDLKGTQSKAGFISILANCEINQVGLQQLLYDVEAGMPFLFIDQLVVQASPGAPSSGNGKLRILLAVSGQWQGTK